MRLTQEERHQALEILSAESGESSRDKSTKGLSNHATALVHARIGDVLSEQGKHDLDALESYERALVIMKEDDLGIAERLEGMYQGFGLAGNLALLYVGIGVVHARLGNWDEAIKALKLAHSYIVGTDTNTWSLVFVQKIVKTLGEYASINTSWMNDCVTIHRNGRIS